MTRQHHSAVILLIGLSMAVFALSVRLVQATENQGGGDAFGYTVEVQPFDWVDAAITGTLTVFPSTDNSFAGPLPVGFTFPFYENTYTDLYVATNGILSFGQGTLTPINFPIPFSTSPNNFIALFWDDLVVGGINTGKVYTQLRGQAPDRMLVIQYEDVTRAATPGSPLNFEALLFENGDMCLQYAAMAGDLSSATAGIEDSDGIDGIDLSGDLASNQRICLIRPPASARVKITPAYSSGFTRNGQQIFAFTVKNTGDLGTDVYDLSVEVSNPAWSAGVSVGTLSSLSAAGLVDTGPVPQGGSVAVYVLVDAPGSANAGDYSQITLTAISQQDPGASADALAQAAIPASFAQVYRSTQTGLRLQFYSANSQIVSDNIAPGSPSGMSIASSGLGNYFVFWEKNYLNANFQSVTDVEYSVISPMGIMVVPETPLTDNSLATLSVRDKNIAAAVNPDGVVAVVFVRDVTDTGLNPPETNSNVYVALLDPAGAILSAPLNLTMNTAFRGPGDLEEPLFQSPRITAAGDHFLVTWIDNRLETAIAERDDVMFAIVDAAGGIVTGITAQAVSDAGVDKYLNPVGAALSGSRVLLAYVRTDAAGNPLEVLYSVRNQTGGVVKAETTLAGAVGSGLDAVELSSDSILLSWIETASSQVNYAILDVGYNLFFGPVQLTTPDGRTAVNVSVSGDDQGNGVLTWEDGSSTQNIFYALVNSGGGLETPPMSILAADNSTEFLLTSNNGGGNAPLVSIFGIYLPVVDR